MITQITMARNELTLIRELLPIWSQYTDGFVFMLDSCTDGTPDCPPQRPTFGYG